MADTVRTLPYFLDPTTGVLRNANGITAQELRDFVVSQMSFLGASVNYLANSGLWFYQRQAPATLTTIGQDGYGPDRWRMCRENAGFQAARVDTNGALETGLRARHYAQFKKITSAGKVLWCQPIEGSQTFPLAGRQVTVQCKMRCPSGNGTTNYKMRLGLIQLNSSGTIDTVPANVVPTTWGSAATDPTLGTNLARIAPDAVLDGATGTVTGNALDCTLSTSWQTFAARFTMPSNAKNVLPAVWSDGQISTNDSVCFGEAGFYDAGVLRDWTPLPYADELLRCERYYEKGYNVDTAPGTSFTVVTEGLYVAMATTGGIAIPFNFRTRKRANPTMAFYDAAGTVNAISIFNGIWNNGGAVTASAANQACGYAQSNNANESSINFQYTAEAEL